MGGARKRSGPSEPEVAGESADLRALATVDGQHHAGDERGFVGGEEERGVRDVPRGSLVTERNRAGARGGNVFAGNAPRAGVASTAIGVSIRPGMIALARIPKRALVTASACVSEFTPAFEILYAVRLPTPAMAAIDEMFTIAPAPCSSSPARRACR